MSNDKSQIWAESIEDRLVELGSRFIRMSEQLPKSVAGTHIGKQLLRSGTSPAANFAEARGAESKADFIHKLKIALKELNESKIWIKMLIQSELTDINRCEPILAEVVELSRILNASITTARKSK